MSFRLGMGRAFMAGLQTGRDRAGLVYPARRSLSSNARSWPHERNNFHQHRLPPLKTEIHMFKFIGGTIGIIFLIGLLVVIGILSLIF
ncbi:hypothetical protein [Paracoccus subflavus]|nr:hypothetical protein [Paracoccus subflavus]